MLENWERITPLEFRSSFAHIWRTEFGTWICKFSDWESTQDLKVDSLKEALEKASKMFIEAKYKQVKKAKRVRIPKAARKKKTEVAEKKVKTNAVKRKNGQKSASK